MDIKNLAYILEAYKCRSINKAAQNVYISQSHLSSIIKNVESEIGYAVFIRTPSGLTATDEGRYFLENAEKIVKNWSSILDVPDIFRDRNTLTICCTPSSNLFQYFLDYQELYPAKCSDTFLESGLKETMTGIVNRRCRIGILMMLESQLPKYSQLASDYKLDFTVMKQHIPMHVYMYRSHPLAGAARVTRADLSCYPTVTDVNLDTDDRLSLSDGRQNTLYVSDRGTSYDAVCKGGYLLAGLMHPGNLETMDCVSKPLADGEPVAICLIKSQLYELNLREQQFIAFLSRRLSCL